MLSLPPEIYSNEIAKNLSYIDVSALLSSHTYYSFLKDKYKDIVRNKYCHIFNEFIRDQKLKDINYKNLFKELQSGCTEIYFNVLLCGRDFAFSYNLTLKHLISLSNTESIKLLLYYYYTIIIDKSLVSLACEKNSYESLELLLKDGREDKLMSENFSALNNVIYNNGVEIMNLLIKHGKSSFNDNNNKAIYFAGKQCRNEIVKILLHVKSVKDTVNINKLMLITVKNGSVSKDLMSIFIEEHGADINLYSNNKKNILGLLYSSYSKNNCNEYYEIFKYLLQLNVIHKDNLFWLLKQTIKDNSKILNLVLLDKRITIKYIDIFLSFYNCSDNLILSLINHHTFIFNIQIIYDCIKHDKIFILNVLSDDKLRKILTPKLRKKFIKVSKTCENNIIEEYFNNI